MSEPRTMEHPVAVPIRLTEHPRAQRHIAAARSWGGMIGLTLTALAAGRAGIDPFHVGLRALAGGVAGAVVAWAAAIAVWRQLARAELRAAAARLLSDLEASMEPPAPAPAAPAAPAAPNVPRIPAGDA
jgi:hypothetical protein